MEYETAGDPMSGLKWTRKTTAKISKELSSSGIDVGRTTVGKILKQLNFSLKTNAKKISSGGKPATAAERKKRDVQFNYINEMVGKFKKENCPIISCDMKKKELIGNFKNDGTRLKRMTDLVNDHDFLIYALGKAGPYGIYDLINNEAFVVVGQFLLDEKKQHILSGDTPEFDVESIENWYLNRGSKLYKEQNKILILVDAGGSNGYRCNMWKVKIQEILCDKYGLDVTVCHYPPGASKWNPVEHRLFSQISNNWRGTPLINYETVLKYIHTTKTTTGLKVDAVLVNKEYKKGIKATKKDIGNLNLKKHETNGSWNYTLSPKKELLKKAA